MLYVTEAKNFDLQRREERDAEQGGARHRSRGRRLPHRGAAHPSMFWSIELTATLYSVSSLSARG